MKDQDAAIAAVRAGREARRIVVLRATGISTDSGIPDFPGAAGAVDEESGRREMATIGHSWPIPKCAKRSWRERLEMDIDRREPNAATARLAELERRGRLDTLITQNVDGLHQKAGVSPQSIVGDHGTLSEVVCMDCGERAPIGARSRACARARRIRVPQLRGHLEVGDHFVRAETGDGRPAPRGARRAGLRFLLAIGTTLAVYPIAGVVPVAKRAGARIAIVNAEPTEMDDLADAVLRGSISEILRVSWRRR